MRVIAKHLLISGRVQGVGYRDWLQDLAGRVGLAGWVRNLRDGRVEAVVAGDSDAVDEVVRACRRGPRLAVVDEINETFAEPPAGRNFVKRTTV